MCPLTCCADRARRQLCLGMLLLALAVCIEVPALAQSGTRNPQGSNARPAQPSANVALEGFCPVCIIDVQKWVRGIAQHQATYDGKTYYFPGQEQKQTFLNDPARYVPALGGDSTVALIDTGRRVAGSVHHAAFQDGRLFLFVDDNEKRQYLADPDKYAKADLALNGNCAVCSVDLNKQVPGKPEIAAYHQGLRYLFPSDAQRKAFLANPAGYAVKTVAPPAAR